MTQDPETCPQCGGPVVHGYGLMGGGMGHYVVCENDACGWMWKEQDRDLPPKEPDAETPAGS